MKKTKLLEMHEIYILGWFYICILTNRLPEARGQIIILFGFRPRFPLSAETEIETETEIYFQRQKIHRI